MTLQSKLQQLFLLDSQVRGMRRRLDAALGRQKALTAKMDQLTRQQAELTDQIKHFQAKASSLEHQASDLDQRVERLRQKMTEVTSNKEYSALLIEVNTLKLNKGQLEDQALAELAHVDELRAQWQQLAAELSEQSALLAGAGSEVQSHQSEVGQRLAEVTAERDEAAKAIPLDTRSIFDRLAASYDGQAMASVREVNRRMMEYSCEGCYMTIPVETVNALYARPNEATSCPNCGRLMFLGEELRATMGPKD